MKSIFDSFVLLPIECGSFVLGRQFSDNSIRNLITSPTGLSQWLVIQHHGLKEIELPEFRPCFVLSDSVTFLYKSCAYSRNNDFPPPYR